MKTVIETSSAGTGLAAHISKVAAKFHDMVQARGLWPLVGSWFGLYAINSLAFAAQHGTSAPVKNGGGRVFEDVTPAADVHGSF